MRLSCFGILEYYCIWLSLETLRLRPPLSSSSSSGPTAEKSEFLQETKRWQLLIIIIPIRCHDSVCPKKVSMTWHRRPRRVFNLKILLLKIYSVEINSVRILFSPVSDMPDRCPHTGGRGASPCQSTLAIVFPLADAVVVVVISSCATSN